MPLGYTVSNPGVGGANLAGNKFTDTDALLKIAFYSQIAFGADAAVPTIVTLTSGVPVQPQTGATWAVTGTFWQATQPVSLAAETTKVIGTVNIAAAQTLGLAAGSAVIGHVIVDSGSITANAGTNLNTSLLALEAGGNLATIAGKDFATQTTLVALNAKVTACNTGAVVLAAGSAVVGHVIVDASSAVIGHVIVDSGTITTVSTVTTVTTVAAVTAITNALPAGSNLLGKVGIDQTTPGTTNAVQDIPGTSGGLSLYSFLSTAAVQAAAIKASAGQVYALHFFNVGAAAVYVRLYNMTTTPGTGDTVVYRAIVPGNTAGAGFVVPIPNGLAFGTGIGIRVSAAVADNDATVLSANGVMGNVFYR